MAKIDVTPDKIRRITDLQELSYIFIPQISGSMLRAAFIALIIEIKNHKDEKILNTNYIEEKYDIPGASICKARARMRKIGLIEYRDSYWKLSSRFIKALDNLGSKLGDLTLPTGSKMQRDKESKLIDYEKAFSKR